MRVAVVAAQVLVKLGADAQTQGREVLVVPYVINAQGLQPKLQKDLAGLEFRFQENGISDHPNFLKWIDKRVKETLRKG